MHIIREATIFDAPLMVKHKEVMRTDRDVDYSTPFIETLSPEEEEKTARNLVLAAESIRHLGVFVIEHNQRIVGSALARTIILSPDYLELYDIGIQPKFRRQSLGTGLLHFAEEWARARGLKGLMLTVSQNNKNAIKCYEKFGFRKTGNRRTSPNHKGKEVVWLEMGKQVVLQYI